MAPQGIAQEQAQELPPIYTRKYYRLPEPKYPGGAEFYGTVPKRNSTFAWSEICATPGPESSLAPVPQVECKMWYNTYVYVPEQRSHVERHFLERYVQGPNGEWLDVVKARRMADYYEQKRLTAMRESMEREEVTSGAAVHATAYTDAYTGDPLVACQGSLIRRQELLEEYGTSPAKAAMQARAQDMQGGWDWDNLRIPWPFGSPDRNKIISQHAYDWFDRNNPYIRSDRSTEFVELPSMYIEREHYGRWQSESAYPSMDPPPLLQGGQRVQYLDL